MPSNRASGLERILRRSRGSVSSPSLADPYNYPINYHRKFSGWIKTHIIWRRAAGPILKGVTRKSTGPAGGRGEATSHTFS